MNYPKYVEVNGKQYKINTDFRVAIECDKIAKDNTIGDYERALAIIYKLFGEEGLKDTQNQDRLLELGLKYLRCGNEIEETEKNNEKRDMDYIQDMDYIEASFMSDFHIDLENTEMHWWKFNKLINGLSNNEFGNCCILNTIRNIRNYDVSKITDDKERQKLIELQRTLALEDDEKQFTKEQEEAMEKFNKLAGL